LKTTRQSLYEKWRAKYAISLTQESVFGVRFDQKISFSLLEEFRNGHFEVQDEASQLVADLVDAKPGDQVLDYCAGSGGKALAFAHKLQGQGQIYLHDIREKALQEAKKRLKRAGIENGQILLPDAPHKQKLLGKMDWIFLDVPCSGTGTLRRNPDLKWKFSDEMLQRLINEQREIAKEALPYLKPGGRIVYATCSILPEENEHQLQFFEEELGLHPVAKPFRSYPTEGGMDGFFGSVLKKLAI
jgi:16S rRNA C967 or C1407 C5-methylase (RsmB/RsmF family)